MNGVTLNTPFPFGKYSGQPLAVVLADRNYTQWALSLADFPIKHPAVFDFIATGGGTVEKDQTPAHNAMQIRFLKPEASEACVRRLAPAVDTEEVKDGGALGPVEIDRQTFEHFGWDVYFVSRHRWSFEESLDDWSSYWHVGIELKPSISEDYPAVLRQVKDRVLRNHATRRGVVDKVVVVTDSFTAKSATLDQVKQMFRSSGVHLFLWSEIAHPPATLDDFDVDDDFLN